MLRQYAKLSLTLPSSKLLFIRFLRKRMSTTSLIFLFLVLSPYEASLSVAFQSIVSPQKTSHRHHPGIKNTPPSKSAGPGWRRSVPPGNLLNTGVTTPTLQGAAYRRTNVPSAQPVQARAAPKNQVPRKEVLPPTLANRPTRPMAPYKLTTESGGTVGPSIPASSFGSTESRQTPTCSWKNKSSAPGAITGSVASTENDNRPVKQLPSSLFTSSLPPPKTPPLPQAPKVTSPQLCSQSQPSSVKPAKPKTTLPAPQAVPVTKAQSQIPGSSLSSSIGWTAAEKTTSSSYSVNPHSPQPASQAKQSSPTPSSEQLSVISPAQPLQERISSMETSQPTAGQLPSRSTAKTSGQQSSEKPDLMEESKIILSSHHYAEDSKSNEPYLTTPEEQPMLNMIQSGSTARSGSGTHTPVLSDDAQSIKSPSLGPEEDSAFPLKQLDQVPEFLANLSEEQATLEGNASPVLSLGHRISDNSLRPTSESELNPVTSFGPGLAEDAIKAPEAVISSHVVSFEDQPVISSSEIHSVPCSVSSKVSNGHKSELSLQLQIQSSIKPGLEDESVYFSVLNEPLVTHSVILSEALSPAIHEVGITISVSHSCGEFSRHSSAIITFGLSNKQSVDGATSDIFGIKRDVSPWGTSTAERVNSNPPEAVYILNEELSKNKVSLSVSMTEKPLKDLIIRASYSDSDGSHLLMFTGEQFERKTQAPVMELSDKCSNPLNIEETAHDSLFNTAKLFASATSEVNMTCITPNSLNEDKLKDEVWSATSTHAPEQAFRINPPADGLVPQVTRSSAEMSSEERNIRSFTSNSPAISLSASPVPHQFVLSKESSILESDRPINTLFMHVNSLIEVQLNEDTEADDSALRRATTPVMHAPVQAIRIASSYEVTASRIPRSRSAMSVEDITCRHMTPISASFSPIGSSLAQNVASLEESIHLEQLSQPFYPQLIKANSLVDLELKEITEPIDSDIRKSKTPSTRVPEQTFRVSSSVELLCSQLSKSRSRLSQEGNSHDLMTPVTLSISSPPSPDSEQLAIVKDNFPSELPINKDNLLQMRFCSTFEIKLNEECEIEEDLMGGGLVLHSPEEAFKNVHSKGKYEPKITRSQSGISLEFDTCERMTPIPVSFSSPVSQSSHQVAFIKETPSVEMPEPTSNILHMRISSTFEIKMTEESEFGEDPIHWHSVTTAQILDEAAATDCSYCKPDLKLSRSQSALVSDQVSRERMSPISPFISPPASPTTQQLASIKESPIFGRHESGLNVRTLRITSSIEVISNRDSEVYESAQQTTELPSTHASEQTVKTTYYSEKPVSSLSQPNSMPSSKEESVKPFFSCSPPTSPVMPLNESQSADKLNLLADSEPYEMPILALNTVIPHVVTSIKVKFIEVPESHEISFKREQLTTHTSEQMINLTEVIDFQIPLARPPLSSYTQGLQSPSSPEVPPESASPNATAGVPPFTSRVTMSSVPGGIFTSVNFSFYPHPNQSSIVEAIPTRPASPDSAYAASVSPLPPVSPIALSTYLSINPSLSPSEAHISSRVSPSPIQSCLGIKEANFTPLENLKFSVEMTIELPVTTQDNLITNQPGINLSSLTTRSHRIIFQVPALISADESVKKKAFISFQDCSENELEVTMSYETILSSPRAFSPTRTENETCHPYTEQLRAPILCRTEIESPALYKDCRNINSPTANLEPPSVSIATPPTSVLLHISENDSSEVITLNIEFKNPQDMPEPDITLNIMNSPSRTSRSEQGQTASPITHPFTASSVPSPMPLSPSLRDSASELSPPRISSSPPASPSLTSPLPLPHSSPSPSHSQSAFPLAASLLTDNCQKGPNRPGDREQQKQFRISLDSNQLLNLTTGQVLRQQEDLLATSSAGHSPLKTSSRQSSSLGSHIHRSCSPQCQLTPTSSEEDLIRLSSSIVKKVILYGKQLVMQSSEIPISRTNTSLMSVGNIDSDRDHLDQSMLDESSDNDQSSVHSSNPRESIPSVPTVSDINIHLSAACFRHKTTSQVSELAPVQELQDMPTVELEKDPDLQLPPITQQAVPRQLSLTRPVTPREQNLQNETESAEPRARMITRIKMISRRKKRVHSAPCSNHGEVMTKYRIRCHLEATSATEVNDLNEVLIQKSDSERLTAAAYPIHILDEPQCHTPQADISSCNSAYEHEEPSYNLPINESCSNASSFESLNAYSKPDTNRCSPYITRISRSMQACTEADPQKVCKEYAEIPYRPQLYYSACRKTTSTLKKVTSGESTTISGFALTSSHMYLAPRGVPIAELSNSADSVYQKTRQNAANLKSAASVFRSRLRRAAHSTNRHLMKAKGFFYQVRHFSHSSRGVCSQDATVSGTNDTISMDTQRTAGYHDLRARAYSNSLIGCGNNENLICEFDERVHNASEEEVDELNIES
ncbi:unnamed protein product [Protopolystoma xenopodis]|uniref:Uncharacterized protein n=1 Tax=Protopolystoma xenopodis TaxID=117903 RepID=A0A3S5ALK5_9PLAT|nr:unnamed protein product [Protopolystoma xenopodis]